MHSILALAAIVAAPAAVMAQLSSLRATMPGSLHQCENTNFFFFDSGNTRPLTVLLLDSAAVPASARSGTLSLQQAVAYKPLQVIQNIQTPDAQEYDFQLQLANGQAFEVFAFYADSGMGKAMSLTRTVTTPLPTATNCLANVQTTVSGLSGVVTTTPASSSTARASTSTSSPSSSVPTTTSRATSTTASVINALSTSSTPAATSSVPLPTNAASTNSVAGTGLSALAVGVLAAIGAFF